MRRPWEKKRTAQRSNAPYDDSSWSEWGDSNSRHPAPKAGALPTALHPGFNYINGKGRGKFLSPADYTVLCVLLSSEANKNSNAQQLLVTVQGAPGKPVF